MRDAFALPFDDAPDRGDGPGLLSVSQITAMVSNAISMALPATVHVVGEMSNVKRHSSGHLYFTLKDAASELSCVMWRSQVAGLKFKPEDGMEVVGTGRVEVFERAGRYQLYLRKLEPRGVGALELAFRQMRERLEKEGLFEPGHKKPLPAYPERMGIVTSPTGAAIADIIRTLRRRFPRLHVLLYPVRVQGAGAAAEIAEAIRDLNRWSADLGGIDLLIVGRGGGSLEDLWAFNEEVVARAIHASRIPVISAVGHETDVTIADLVADVRAATPTAAAELAVPVLDDIVQSVEAVGRRMTATVTRATRNHRQYLRAVLQRRALADPLVIVRKREQVLDEIGHRAYGRVTARLGERRRRVEQASAQVGRIAPHLFLSRMNVRLAAASHRIVAAAVRRHASAQHGVTMLARALATAAPDKKMEAGRERLAREIARVSAAWTHRLAIADARLQRIAGRLDALSHVSILNRGYSITRAAKGRKIVKSQRDVREGERIVTEVADGTIESRVVDQDQGELFE